jgi:hypothetical protein
MSDNQKPEQEESYVSRYVDATISASTRARVVMIVMITAAVLVFTVFWNQGGTGELGPGWLDSRIKIRRDALKYFYSVPDIFIRCSPAVNYTVTDRQEYDRAKSFIDKAGLHTGDSQDKKTIEGDIEQLKRVRAEQINLVRVPFFGVAFDSNDMGIFAGLSFTVILLWLWFSLGRELRNLRLAFKEAEGKGDRQQRLCYELLAMHQIFTLPPIEGQEFRRIKVGVASALHLIPGAVFIFEHLSDVQTRNIGMIVNPARAEFGLIVGAVFLGLIIMLTVLCLSYYMRIDREWRKAWNALQITANNAALHRPKTIGWKAWLIANWLRISDFTLTFAAIFIASATALLIIYYRSFTLADESLGLQLTSKPLYLLPVISLVISGAALILSAINTLVSITITRNKDKREKEKHELEVKKLKRELGEAEQPPPLSPEESGKQLPPESEPTDENPTPAQLPEEDKQLEQKHMATKQKPTRSPRKRRRK